MEPSKEMALALTVIDRIGCRLPGRRQALHKRSRSPRCSWKGHTRRVGISASPVTPGPTVHQAGRHSCKPLIQYASKARKAGPVSPSPSFGRPAHLAAVPTPILSIRTKATIDTVVVGTTRSVRLHTATAGWVEVIDRVHTARLGLEPLRVVTIRESAARRPTAGADIAAELSLTIDRTKLLISMRHETSSSVVMMQIRGPKLSSFQLPSFQLP